MSNGMTGDGIHEVLSEFREGTFVATVCAFYAQVLALFT